MAGNTHKFKWQILSMQCIYILTYSELKRWNWLWVLIVGFNFCIQWYSNRRKKWLQLNNKTASYCYRLAEELLTSSQ